MSQERVRADEASPHAVLHEEPQALPRQLSVLLAELLALCPEGPWRTWETCSWLFLEIVVQLQTLVQQTIERRISALSVTSGHCPTLLPSLGRWEPSRFRSGLAEGEVACLICPTRGSCSLDHKHVQTVKGLCGCKGRYSIRVLFY